MTRITAANGQYIGLTYAAGKLSLGELRDGRRHAQRHLHDRRALERHLYPGTPAERQVTYGYDATPRLTAITQAGLADERPERRRDLRLQLGQAHRGALRRLPRDHEARRPRQRHLRLATQATVKRYGTVAGTANQVMNQEVSSGAPPRRACPTSS